MKRFALLVVAIAAGTAAAAQAQVIGTYRPSLVTYYPSTTSVTPVAYAKPIPTAGRYVANPYGTYPMLSRANPATGTTQVVQAAYGNNYAGAANYANTGNYANTAYYSYPVNYANTTNYAYAANYPTTAAAPIVSGNCGCAPFQTIGTTSYYPTTAVAPAAYQQTYVGPASQAAYQQPLVAPVQPIGAQAGTINGKYFVGKGLLGRPKIYAQGQPIRNVLRTILP